MYETDVTVRRETSAEAERLDRWATATGLKVTHIVLARGRMPTRPMLTLTDRASCAAESARTREVTALLRADGFEPGRVKIESWPWAPEVPRSGRWPQLTSGEREFVDRLVRAVPPTFEGR